MGNRVWRLRRAVTPRLVGVDLSRCLALVGMICTHLVPSLGPDGQVTVLQQLAGGRASALFAVLAGLSMALVTGATTPVGGIALLRARVSLGVRAVLIATLGLWLAQLDSGIAVILPYYGVLFLLGLPFLRLRATALAVLAAAVALLAPLVSNLLRPYLPVVAVGQPAPPDLLTPGGLLAGLAFTGTYPAVPWTAYLLAGLALGRLPLRDRSVATRVMLSGAALALSGWLVGHLMTSSAVVQGALIDSLPEPMPWPALEQQLVGGLYGTTPTGSWWWLLVAAPHSGTPVDLAQTGGSAMVVIGGCLLLTRWHPRFWSVAGGAGAMTLSLYTGHVVLAASGLPRTAPDAVRWHLLLVLGIGAAFAAARLRGPLEWLVGGICGSFAALAERALGPPPSEPGPSGRTGGSQRYSTSSGMS